MGYAAANQQMGMEVRDVWTTAYVNDLPDSAFLYIAPGGTKTDGRTDGAHRFFPVRDATGKPDAAHIRNAMARIPQATSIPAAARMAAMTKAKAMAAAHPDIGSGPNMGYEGSAGSGRSSSDDLDALISQMMGASPDDQKKLYAAMGAMMGGRSRDPGDPEAPLECRSFDVVVHLRADGDGRTLVGRAVPYGVRTELPGGGTERFVPGAFAKQLAPAAADQLQRVKLYASHTDRLAGQQPIGRTAMLMDRPDGLHGEWPLYNTSKASDSLELVRSGEVTGLSIGFKALTSRPAADGVTERHSAHLDHVTLTHEPVYDGAAVLAVRAVGALKAGRPAARWRGDLLKAQGILASLATGG
jgi:HK97 family phage prohead protease